MESDELAKSEALFTTMYRVPSWASEELLHVGRQLQFFLRVHTRQRLD